MTVNAAVRRLERVEILASTAAIWFLAKFLRYLFPPLFDPLQETYAVSNADLGLAFTGFMLVYALAQFPSGLLADRFGSVAVVTGGALLASLAALVVSLEVAFPVLVAAMVVMGAGTGVHKTVAVGLLSAAYPTRTGRALGIFDTVGTFGGVAAPAAVVLVALVPTVLEPSWRSIFLVASVLGLVLGVSFARRVSRRLPREAVGPPAGDRPSVTPGAYLELFGEWRFSVFVLVTVLFAFAYNGTVAFAPLFLTDEAGLDPTAASALYAALFLSSLIQLVTGDVSDRIGTLPVVVSTLGLGTLGLLAFVSLSGTGSAPLLAISVVLLGIGAHGFRPVRAKYLLSIVPPAIAGGGLGIVRTTLMGAGAIAPAVVGVLSESIGFGPAFWVLAASIGCATLLSFVLLLSGDSAP